MDADRFSNEYYEIRKQLESMDTTRLEEETSTPLRLRIPVVLFFSRQIITLSHTLVQTVQIVTRQYSVRLMASDQARARVEIVGVWFTSRTVMDNKGLHLLDVLTRYGVEIYNIPRVQLNMNTSAPNLETNEPFNLVKVLQCLVGGCDSTFPGVQRLTISNQTDPKYLIPLLTAQVSTRLEEVLTHISEGGRDQNIIDLWRCVAYTLFSAHAQHNIARLTLEFSGFRATHVDAIRAVLSGWRPVHAEDMGAGIFDRLLGQTSEHLLCAKVFLFDPSEKSSDMTLFHLPIPMKLRVIKQERTNKDMTTVHLPGWGMAWACNEETVSSANTCVQQMLVMNGDTVHGFKEICIRSLDEASEPAATMLTSLIGNQVNLLEIKRVNNYSFETWFKEVSPYLARMHKLKINGTQLGDLNALVEAMVSRSPAISNLNLNCDISSDADAIHNIFVAIGDPNHDFILSWVNFP